MSHERFITYVLGIRYPEGSGNQAYSCWSLTQNEQNNGLRRLFKIDLSGDLSVSQAKKELVKIQNLYFSYWA